MATNITKTNGNKLKGTFTKDKISPAEADAEFHKCLIDNRIDFLGWF